MNLRCVLWENQRNVFLYASEAYRRWMLKSDYAWMATSSAEGTLTGYIGIVFFGVLMAVYPETATLGRLRIFCVIAMGGMAAHLFLRRRWTLASEIYERYRSINYPIQALIDASMVITLMFSLAIFGRHRFLIPLVIVAHWLLIGTLFHAILERRRLTEVAPST